MRLEAKLDWLENAMDPDPEEQAAAFKQIDDAVDAFAQSQAPDGSTPAPAAPDQAQAPSEAHIAMLRANPDKAAEFDAKFGEGAAAIVLKSGGRIQR
jgi:hypothetical protein